MQALAGLLWTTDKAGFIYCQLRRWQYHWRKKEKRRVGHVVIGAITKLR